MYQAKARRLIRENAGVRPWILKIWERDQKLLDVFGGYRIQDTVHINAPKWTLDFVHPHGPVVCPLQANIDFEWMLHAFRKDGSR